MGAGPVRAPAQDQGEPREPTIQAQPPQPEPPPANTPQRIQVGQEGWEPVLGQHLYLAGTGKWHTGQHFGAVIVDVRASDDTVKVRYTDGSFKRFGRPALKGLVKVQQNIPKAWEEWNASSEHEELSEMDRLHDQIMRALKDGDTTRAAVLEERFKVLSTRDDAMAALRQKLHQAVSNGDYLLAHELQHQINKAEQEQPQRLKPPPEALDGAQPEDHKGIIEKSAKKALGGGLAGASAMTLQVACFYWLRTTMNYQYRYGTSTAKALRTLYADGGISRFYRGLGPALLQGPLARFADTAANAGVLALFEETEAKHWPAWVKTIFASTSAAAMRASLLPLDTVKTLMQVHGREGLLMLAGKYRLSGAPIFFHGAIASSAATFIGHYPWFVVFNILNERIPNYHERPKAVVRNACIGFCASVCSDAASNCLRVLKTCRQTNETTPYASLVRRVVHEDGVAGLFGRGLKTRILANGAQGIMFSVLYKLFEEKLI